MTATPADSDAGKAVLRFQTMNAGSAVSPFLRAMIGASGSIGAGLAMAYSLPPKLFPAIELVGLLPFFAILLLPLGRWGLFWLGTLAGWTAAGVYTAWFFNAFPLTWLNIENFWVGITLTFVGWATINAAVAGPLAGVLLLAARNLLRGNAYDIVRLALLVAAADYLRAFLSAGHPFLIGPGNIAGDNWAVSIWGYALADSYPLRQLAAIGGLYALSAVAALPSALAFVAIAGLIRDRRPMRALGQAATLTAGLLGLALAGGWALGRAYYQPERTMRLAVISSAFYPEDWLVERFPARSAELLTRLLDRASSPVARADIILMPEGSSLASSTNPSPENQRSIINGLLDGDPNRILVNPFPVETGSVDPLHPATNDISIFDGSGSHIGTYPKHFLMPFGEYLPTAFDWVGRRLGYSRWLDQFASRGRIPGKASGVFATPAGAIGVLGCAELISPYVSRKTVREGAEVLLYTASIGILRGSERLRAQNLAIAQIRAAETRRFVAYAANGGHSFFVDPTGRVLWENPAIAPGVKVIEAKTNKTLTPAVRYANWFPLAAMGALLADGLFRHTIRKRQPAVDNSV